MSEGQPLGMHKPVHPHSYSLRHRLDLVFGALLVCTVMAGSLAIGLIVQQRHDALVVYSLHEQERLADRVVWLGERLLTEYAYNGSLNLEQVNAFHQDLEQLSRNLEAFKRGGEVSLRDGRNLRVPVVQGRLAKEHLNAALVWVARYQTQLNRYLDSLSSGDSQEQYSPEQFVQQGEELRTFIRSLAAWAESDAIRSVVRAGWLLLLCMFSGLCLFFLGVWIIRRFITLPLQHIAEGIRSMQRSGRLVKLPIAFANELGIVAAGFNDLAQHVEAQKTRLREHVVELQRINDELDRMSHLKDEFLATISHQFRTPLMLLVENLTQLRDGVVGTLSQDQQAVVLAMDQSAGHLSKLIENALTLSLMRSGRRTLNCQPGDLDALLREAQASWQVEGVGIKIQLSCGELPQVYMDDAAIRQVMDHLLRNALRHSSKQSQIWVWVKARECEVEVSVRDHGEGLTSEQLSQLFQPFVHVHTPDAPGSEGSGLGLALCRQVIERHRGNIRAESTPGQGLTVTFTLPVASPRFLFEEACRLAQEEAEYEHQQFGVILVGSASVAQQNGHDALVRAESLLRSHTHRGDRFVWLDDCHLIIVAVTNQTGLMSMLERLQWLLHREQLPVGLASACFPSDGNTSDRLLQAAREVLSHVAPSCNPVRVEPKEVFDG